MIPHQPIQAALTVFPAGGTVAGMTRRTLIIGLVTLLAAAAMAVVFVTSATAATTVPTESVLEAKSMSAGYELGAGCPFGGH